MYSLCIGNTFVVIVHYIYSKWQLTLVLESFVDLSFHTSYAYVQRVDCNISFSFSTISSFPGLNKILHILQNHRVYWTHGPGPHHSNFYYHAINQPFQNTDIGYNAPDSKLIELHHTHWHHGCCFRLFMSYWVLSGRHFKWLSSFSRNIKHHESETHCIVYLILDRD